MKKRMIFIVFLPILSGCSDKGNGNDEPTSLIFNETNRETAFSEDDVPYSESLTDNGNSTEKILPEMSIKEVAKLSKKRIYL